MLLASPMRRAVADIDMRPDGGQRADLDIFADYGGGMDAGLDLHGGIKAVHGAREGSARLGARITVRRLGLG